jgi:glycosyltransferase involved in cell wall biosynthesis
MKNLSKKIVIIFNNLNIGGIETKIVDICKYYSRQKKIKVYLYLKTLTGPNLKLISPSITIIEPKIFKLLKLRTILFPFWLALNFKSVNPDLILAFGNYSAISASIGKIFSFVKSNLIISEDSSVIQQLKSDSFSFFRTQMVKFFYRFSNSLIVLSQSGKNHLLQLVPSQKSKIAILENWLPLSYPKSQKTQNRNIDILFLGRFEPQKNPLKFLDISKSLISKKPNLKVVVVGYGSLKNEIKKYITTYKLNSNIILRPQTTKAYKYFERSKIFLLSSEHEGFPLTILESTASGSLPVCVNLPEIREYFDFKPISILYNSKNEAIKNIYSLLNNYSKLVQLSVYYQQKTINNQQKNFQKTINFLNKYL